MNPELMAYQQQVEQDALNNQMNPEIAHPFQSGSQMAINAIRQSLGGISPDQQAQQARAVAFMRYGQALGDPRQNFNQALGQGLEGYMQERANQAQINAQMYAQALKQQQIEQEYMRRLQHEENVQRMHQETLAQREKARIEELEEKKRFHNLTHEDRLAKIANKKAVEEGLTAEGTSEYGVKEVPLARMGKDFARDWGKEVNKKVSQIQENETALQDIRDMRDIFNEYPDIASDFANVLMTSDNTNSVWNWLKRQATSDKKLAAVERLRKLSSGLNLATIKGISGRGATDLLKKEIQQAAPSGRLTYEAFDKIAASWEDRAEENIRKARVMEDSLSRGMYPFINKEEMKKEKTPEISEISPVSSTGMVRVRLPDGKTGTIPASKLDQALSMGATQIE